MESLKIFLSFEFDKDNDLKNNFLTQAKDVNGGAASGVGPALPQPGQQRVIAPLAGVAVAPGALLGQAVAELCPYPARAEATNW